MGLQPLWTVPRGVGGSTVFAPIGAVKVTLATLEEQQPSPISFLPPSLISSAEHGITSPVLGRGTQQIGQDLTTSRSGRHYSNQSPSSSPPLGPRRPLAGPQGVTG